MEKLTTAHLPKVKDLENRITPRDRLVLFCVMYRNTFCPATISDIASLSGMSRSTVYRRVTNLVSAKYLTKSDAGYTAVPNCHYVPARGAKDCDPLWKQVSTEELPIAECGVDLTANYVVKCLDNLDTREQSTVGMGKLMGISRWRIGTALHERGLVVDGVERNRKRIGQRLQKKKQKVAKVASVKAELPEIEEEAEVDSSFLLSVQRKIAKSEKWLADQGIEDVQAWLATPAAVWAVRCGQVSEYWICQQGVSAVECAERYGFDAGCFTSKLDKVGKVG